MDRADFERLSESGAFAPDAFSSFGFYSVPDLTMEERRPPEFIIEGMIPCGLTFLSGAPKIRKSFMALQMATAVATGQPFLGHDTRKCDVAYLDLEGSKSRISFRAERMSTQIPRNVFVTNSITERLADGLVDKLRQLHRERPSIRFIIVDTFSRARGSVRSGGQNAYDVDVALLEPVQRMALEENIAVLFILVEVIQVLGANIAQFQISNSFIDTRKHINIAVQRTGFYANAFFEFKHILGIF